jgi:hypothetical protein
LDREVELVAAAEAEADAGFPGQKKSELAVVRVLLRLIFSPNPKPRLCLGHIFSKRPRCSYNSHVCAYIAKLNAARPKLKNRVHLVCFQEHMSLC